MASYVCHVRLFVKQFVDNSFKSSLGGVRFMSRAKHYGWRKQDGEYVTSGTIVARQFRMRYCPGLNVGFRGGYLAARVPGKVVVTCETTNFRPGGRYVELNYPDKPPMYKKYYNVIPEPQHQRFKLIDWN